MKLQLYGYCINKNSKYYSSKCYEYCFNNLPKQKRKSFISDQITIDNYYYLLLLCETKRYNIKWKIMNFRKFCMCYYFNDKINDSDIDNI